MVQRFPLALRSRGGIVSRTIVFSTTKPLIAPNPQYNLHHIDLVSSEWAAKLIPKNGFTTRMETTGKVEISEVVKKEADLLYLHNIVSVIEKHSIPSNLIMNLD